MLRGLSNILTDTTLYPSALKKRDIKSNKRRIYHGIFEAIYISQIFITFIKLSTTLNFYQVHLFHSIMDQKVKTLIVNAF